MGNMVLPVEWLPEANIFPQALSFIIPQTSTDQPCAVLPLVS
jgi:hypothetical protein